MKKLIAIMLLIAMCLSLFAGCGEEEQSTTTAAPQSQSDLENAKAYLLSMYQSGKKDAPIELGGSKDVLKSVVVAKVTYNIAWSVEVTSGPADGVTVGESLTANCVQLCIPQVPKEDLLFTATATISDPNGATTTATFNYKVVGYAAMEELVKQAYALEDGQAMEEEVVLTGVVTAINSAYDEDNKRITVTMQVGELADMPIKCYNLTGDGAENLWTGDTITVSGIIKNYGGTIEFDAGCKITSITKSSTPPPEAPEDPKQIVAEAYALEKDATLPYIATLTGVITTVDTPYTEQYQNVTVSMVVEGCENQPIKCYRLKGEGADQLAPGDTITVNGIIKNYNGTIEFDQGCKLRSFVKGTGPLIVAPEDPKQIVAEAYALADGTILPYPVTLTGVITAVDTPYDAGYGNITVTITIEGCESQPIKCYRMKGIGADALKAGDTITVTGTIKNYGGTIEFDSGCSLIAVVNGENEAVVAPADQTQIVDDAYALEKDTALAYTATLTGKVTSVDEAYSADYQNITVTIQVAGRESKPIKCYRLKGEGVDQIARGDTITVTGIIKNYNGTVEFDTGCRLDSRVSGGSAPVVQETDPAKILEAAKALKENEEMSYDVTLSGKVTTIEDAYSADYQNISVTIAVTGTRSFLKCYRMKGTGVDKVAVGDTITVTGRIKNFYGEVELVNGNMTQRTSGGGSAVKVETDPQKIVDAAYALSENQQLAYDATLSGKVASVDDAYSADYQNITVTIQVSGRESKPIKCYRLKGDGVDKIAVGDTITVKGRLKNYNGTVEFDTGCQLTNRVSGGGSVVVQETDPAKIMAAAGKLKENEEMSYDVTLTGKVTAVNDAYNEEFQNITVTIAVNGTRSFLKCYRLKGDGVAQVAANDTITVTGRIKNYYGELELVNCTMTQRTSGGGTAVKVETDPAKIIDAAYALEKEAELPYDATLTGKVTNIGSPYDSNYKNITVTIQVAGSEDQPIVCFRLKGEGVEQICENDTITVEGRLKNYNGTIEFVNCTMTKRVSGGGTVVNAPTDPKDIVAAAYALEPGKSLPYRATLTGTITEIDEEGYSTQYKNITVVITVAGCEDKPIKCYRMKGDGADSLKVGDTITVSGVIKNYQHSSGDCEIEFDAGCTLDKKG